MYDIYVKDERGKKMKTADYGVAFSNQLSEYGLPNGVEAKIIVDDAKIKYATFVVNHPEEKGKRTKRK